MNCSSSTRAHHNHDKYYVATCIQVQVLTLPSVRLTSTKYSPERQKDRKTNRRTVTPACVHGTYVTRQHHETPRLQSVSRQSAEWLTDDRLRASSFASSDPQIRGRDSSAIGRTAHSAQAANGTPPQIPYVQHEIPAVRKALPDFDFGFGARS